ncbi:flagellar assembly protein FliW [Paenibacillus kandeliae]|uniref:flagellar assembly protein FliW n=1 Tax=Paenibacillus kandeliae TaxID=3231269 RepID=UPI00345AD6D6
MSNSSISPDHTTTLEESNYHFAKGIPGFPELNQYTVIPQYESFSLLQAADNPRISFIMVDPFVFFPQYEFELPQDVQEELEINDEQHVAVRCIVTWHTQSEKITMNLAAPIIFNVEQQQAKQIILQNTPYTTKHPLQSQTTKQTKEEL